MFFFINDDMPNPIHNQNNKSQLAGDTGQWAVLAAEYLQKGLDKLARWSAR